MTMPLHFNRYGIAAAEERERSASATLSFADAKRRVVEAERAAAARLAAERDRADAERAREIVKDVSEFVWRDERRWWRAVLQGLALLGIVVVVFVMPYFGVWAIGRIVWYSVYNYWWVLLPSFAIIVCVQEVRKRMGKPPLTFGVKG